MSYYGVRSIKFVKNEQGLFNVSGKYYDSSIRNLDGTRHWQEGIFFNTWETKDKMEKILFEDILDGNIHYTGGGKYALIKRLFVKDDEELKRLTKLKEQAFDIEKIKAKTANRQRGGIRCGIQYKATAQQWGGHVIFQRGVCSCCLYKFLFHIGAPFEVSHRFLVMGCILVNVIRGCIGGDAIHHLHHVIRAGAHILRRFSRGKGFVLQNRLANVQIHRRAFAKEF